MAVFVIVGVTLAAAGATVPPMARPGLPEAANLPTIECSSDVAPYEGETRVDSLSVDPSVVHTACGTLVFYVQKASESTGERVAMAVARHEGFERIAFLDRDPTSFKYGVRAVVSSSGDVLVSWLDSLNSLDPMHHDDVLSVVIDVEGRTMKVGAPFLINDDAVAAHQAHLDAGLCAGAPCLVWADDRLRCAGDGGNGNGAEKALSVYLWMLDEPGTNGKVSDPEIHVRSPSITTGPDGTLFVVWMTRRAAETYDVLLAESPDGQGFCCVRKIMEIPAAEGMDSVSLRAVDGRLVLLWSQTSERVHSIQVATSTDGGMSFGDVQVLFEYFPKEHGAGHYHNPVLAAGPSGALVAAWSEGDDQGGFQVWAAFSPDGGISWGEPISIVGPNVGWRGGARA